MVLLLDDDVRKIRSLLLIGRSDEARTATTTPSRKSQTVKKATKMDLKRKKVKMMELVRLKPRSRGKKGPRPLSSASEQSYSL